MKFIVLLLLRWNVNLYWVVVDDKASPKVIVTVWFTPVAPFVIHDRAISLYMCMFFFKKKILINI